MDLQLSGRTALVTGASAGIGEGIARILAAEGVRLALTARREDKLRTLAEAIATAGGERPVLLPADITDPAEQTRLARDSTAALGVVDILVNCAGASRPTEPGAPDAVWDEGFALNFTAPRRLAETLLPGMRARGFGRIVNITGTAEPRDLNVAGAAKAALHVWAKGLSCVVAAEGVTVNCIPPGRIRSEQIMERLHPTEEDRQAFIAAHIPAGRFGEPEDIGRLVAFLASPLAAYITGTVVPVDGGMQNRAI